MKYKPKYMAHNLYCVIVAHKSINLHPKEQLLNTRKSWLNVLSFWAGCSSLSGWPSHPRSGNQTRPIHATLATVTDAIWWQLLSSGWMMVT